ncbi:MAG: glycosyltransferase family 4 protein [bacterium]|nr:glycosyltransferase family 4 protein [bacterium]
MNILHLRSSEFYGGPERAILGQCKFYKKARLVCASFVRPGKSSDFLARCAETGVKTVPIEDSFTGDFRVIGRLARLMKSEQIDILVSHDYKANFFGRHAAKKCSVKQIAHFRGRTTEDNKVRLYNKLDNYLLRKILHILVVSEKSREVVIAMGVDPGKIIVVPNGFDLAKASATSDRNRSKEEPVRMVAAGRFSSEKGYDILIDALALVKKKGPDFRVELYGEGPEESNLKNLVHRHGLDDHVSFCGFVPDLLPIFRQADLMLLPSRSEGMPNVVLEAWSQQLGVVAAAVGGLPEMIQSGHNGLLVTPEDSSDLADKIIEAITDRSRMYEFGRLGYETLVERYSFERQAVLLAEIYNRILTNA